MFEVSVVSVDLPESKHGRSCLSSSNLLFHNRSIPVVTTRVSSEGVCASAYVCVCVCVRACVYVCGGCLDYAWMDVVFLNLDDVCLPLSFLHDRIAGIAGNAGIARQLTEVIGRAQSFRHWWYSLSFVSPMKSVCRYVCVCVRKNNCLKLTWRLKWEG